MRGFGTKSWADVIRKGLRRYAENTRGEPELIECHCLCPTEKGLGLPVQITSMNSGSWSGEPFEYLYGSGGVLIEDSTGEPIEVL